VAGPEGLTVSECIDAPAVAQGAGAVRAPAGAQGFSIHEADPPVSIYLRSGHYVIPIAGLIYVTRQIADAFSNLGTIPPCLSKEWDDMGGALHCQPDMDKAVAMIRQAFAALERALLACRKLGSGHPHPNGKFSRWDLVESGAFPDRAPGEPVTRRGQ